MLKILGKISRILFVVCVIVAATSQFVAFVAQWIRPDKIMCLPEFLSMVEPFLFLANLLFALIGILLWNKWFFVSLLAVLLSSTHIGSYFYPRFLREYEMTEQSSASKKKIKILSYNVKNFKNSLTNMNEALNQVSPFKPDIVSFAEFSPLGEDGVKVMESKFPQLKYHVSNKGLNSKLASEFGILIFSKYPLIHPSAYESQGLGIAVIADAIIDYGDTVRLFALHMHSTGYNALSHEKSFESYISDSIEDGDTDKMKSRAKTLFNTISANAVSRSYQADTIRQKIEESPYKTIVMGDFNDTPYSYVVRRVMGDTHLDSFREVVRNEYGYSFNLLHKLFRIDYILPDGNYYDVVSYDSFDSESSDHNPVMVTIHKK